MKAPFPYFGSKSRVAGIVWERFGEVKNYVEPFCGSAAVLLARPDEPEGVSRTETVNDADGLLANFWRAMVHDPDAVAHYADWPVNEADLHARHLWMVGQRDDLTARLMGDPDWFDAKAAGWWVWGISAWIGGGWCSGEGPWQSVDGIIADVRKPPNPGNAGQGVRRRIPCLSSAGQGVNRISGTYAVLDPIAERMRRVRVACGDWRRVTSKAVTYGHGLTGVFLDPPYPEGAVDYNAGDRSTYQDVQDWALENGDDPLMRIAVCGYESDHNALEDAGWSVVRWATAGGYGSQGDGEGRENAKRETIWFSPHCLSERQATLF